MRLIPTKKDIAFVEYADEGSASVAKDALHNYKLDGETKIKVLHGPRSPCLLISAAGHVCAQVVGRFACYTNMHRTPAFANCIRKAATRRAPALCN